MCSDIEDTVIDYLKKFEVIAEKIEETNEKTPDFIVRGKENVLIELKEKFDAQTVHEDQKHTLDSGDIYERTHTTGYWQTISNVIEKGIEQLVAQKSNTNSKYCLLFIVTSGVNPSTQVKQFESTFYGRKSIIDFESDSDEAKWCYYFSKSLFSEKKNIIDGAFVINGGNGQSRLLINDLSPQYDCFKKSEFFAKFKSKIGIVDPVELEASKSILIADTIDSREDEEAIKKYVFDKYSINRGMVLDIPQTVFQVNIDA